MPELPARPLRFGWPAVVVLLAALPVWIAAAWADRAERVLPIEVECLERECSVRAGDAELSVPVDRHGMNDRGVGLYVFHSHEFDRPQYFRGLRVESTNSEYALELALTDIDSASGWQVDDGWEVVPGRGITHQGLVGERSVATLNRFEAHDFKLKIEIVNPVDSGVLLRAADGSNGTVFVVRSRQNDMFVFEMDEGQPGPIRQLVALRELSVAREALRLAGIVTKTAWLAALSILVLRFLASSVGPGLWSRRFGLLQASTQPLWLLPSLGLSVFVAMAAIAWFGFGAVPHLPDETAYLFQAKVFAGGALWAPAPAAPTIDFFLHEHILLTPDRWFGKYPPLFPGLLALGVLFQAPWLINPLLGAATLLGIFWLAREFVDWRWATVAALLAMSSPFFLVMGGTMMSHIASALLVTGFLLFFLRALNRADPRWGLAAGASLGLLVWTRPYTALLVMLGGAIHGLIVLSRGPDRRAVWKTAAAVALLLIPLAVGFLAWNGLYSDDATLAVGLYDAYDDGDGLGFGEEKGRGWLKTWGTWGHTPAKALRSVHTFMDYTSHDFLGWPLGLSLVLAAGSLLLRGGSSSERLLWLVPLGLIWGHMLYWATQHVTYGARYWFSALPALIVLTMLGLRRAVSTPAGKPVLSTGVVVALALLVGWNLTSYLPPRLAELRQYGGVDADLKDEIERRRLDHALVLVPTEGLMFNDGFFMNDPFLREGNVYVRDLGYRNAEIVGQYPDRPVYRWADGELQPVRSAVRRVTVTR